MCSLAAISRSFMQCIGDLPTCAPSNLVALANPPHDIEMYSWPQLDLICVRCGNECAEPSPPCPRCGALARVNICERMFSGWAPRLHIRSVPERHNRTRTRRVADTGGPIRRNGRRVGVALCAVVLLAAATFLPRPTAHWTVGKPDPAASVARRTTAVGFVSKGGGNTATIRTVPALVASAPLQDVDAILSRKAHLSPVTVSAAELDSATISSARRALDDGNLGAARRMLSEVSPGGKPLRDYLTVKADVVRLESRRNRLIRQALACADMEEWTCVSINARKSLSIDRRSQIAKTLLARAAAGATGTADEERPEDRAAPQ